MQDFVTQGADPVVAQEKVARLERKRLERIAADWWRRWRPSPPSKADLPANKRGSRAARSRARSGRADLVDPKRAERDGKPRAEAARGGRK